MADIIEIVVGDVNDVEARVYARYQGAAADTVVLRGSLRGPYCETARTLPAEFEFRDTGRPGEALAVVADPCTWSAEMPHVYRAELEARDGERVVAEYCETIGLRRRSDQPGWATR